MILEVLALVLSLGGAVYVAQSYRGARRIGFSMWILSNTLWLGISLGRGDLPQVVLWGAYLFTSVLGVRASSTYCTASGCDQHPLNCRYYDTCGFNPVNVKRWGV